MSHVDDGTLHAYLDGELSPVEVERLDTHIAGCPVCRARLDEERALIDRAARLLGMAVPAEPERAAPPLHQLQRRASTWSRLRVPLAWAATIVIAVGMGYFAGASSFRVPQNSLARGESQPVADVAASSAPAAGAADTRSRVLPATPTDDEQRTAALPLGNAQASDRVVRAETDQQRQAPAANAAEPGRLQDDRVDALANSSPAAAAPAQLPRDRASPTLREVAPAAAPSPAASGAASIAPSVGAVHGYRDANSVRISTSWPAIEAKPARDLLGAAPAVIPGFAVRSMRRNPGPVKEVVVEQMIAGAVVSLFEQPLVVTRALEEAPLTFVDGQVSSDSLAAKTRRNERLARFVGGLRVEIAGPLPADSLSRLLDLVRP